MEERDFFDERTEKKMATLNCPHCHQPAEYEVTWIVRTKKRQLPGRGDERDRARFAKARSYMLRKDDLMGCKNMQALRDLRRAVGGLHRVGWASVPAAFGIFLRSGSQVRHYARHLY